MPKLVGFVGDTQTGSKTALAKATVLDDGDHYGLSLHQQWLLDCYNDCIAKVKYHAAGHEFHLKLGGDLVDGSQHHGSAQTFGTKEDQERLSAELLMPFANMASRIHGLKGTDAHTGPSGGSDKAVLRMLGVNDSDVKYRHRQDYDGALLDWAHHTTMARKPHTRGNSLNALINDIYFQSLEEAEPLPSLIVRHHVHLYDDRSDHRKGMRAIACPGWQLHTAFTRRLSPHSIADIGVVLWWPDTMRVLPILYKPKEDPIEYV